MKHTLNTLSDKELINLYKTSNSKTIIIDSILERHKKLLSKIAFSQAQKYSNSSYEDNLQNAKIALIIACQRFDHNSDVKFSSYLYKTVFYYLVTCIENESFVHCPTNMREVKSFLAGKYDDDFSKIEKIKKKYKLQTDEDLIKFEKQFRLLNPNTITIEDEWFIDNLSSNSQDFTDDVYLKVFYDSLSYDEQLVTKLTYQGYTCAEISNLLSKDNEQFTEKHVKLILDKVKTKLA